MTFQISKPAKVAATACASVLTTLAISPITYADTIEEEVIVSASRLPVEQAQTGRATTLLDAQRLENIGYQYAADIFRTVPGIAVSRSGGYSGTTQLRLRGAEANHVLVLIDGIDATAAGSGEFDFSSLVTADIERIEILRGPQSGLYGSNALAGVISISTRTPTEGLEISTQIEGGSDDIWHGTVSVAGGNETINGRLSFTSRTSAFDLSTVGSEDDQDENNTFSGRLNFKAGEHLDLSLYARRTDRETDTDLFDFSGGPFQGILVDDDSFNDTEIDQYGLQATLNLADDRSITRISVDTAENSLDGGVFGNASERDQWRLESSWFWSNSSDLTQRTTLFWQDEEESFRNTVPTDPSQIPTQRRDLTGFGIEHRIAVEDRLFITGVIREDRNDDFDDASTYAIDAAYQISAAIRLHASYGTGVTNPTFFEQFGFTPGFFTGNPDLEPESSTGWDAGIAVNLADANMAFDLTYFDADLEDEIISVFPSVDNASEDSERQGMELTASWQPGPNTMIDLAYTYTDAEGPTETEVRRPEHTASLTAVQRALDERLMLSATLIYNGSQFDSDFRNFFTNGFVAENTELDSYTLFNLQGRYILAPGIEAYARIENLFDEDYTEVIGYATPGRAVFLGVELTFQR